MDQIDSERDRVTLVATNDDESIRFVVTRTNAEEEKAALEAAGWMVRVEENSPRGRRA